MTHGALRAESISFSGGTVVEARRSQVFGGTQKVDISEKASGLTGNAVSVNLHVSEITGVAFVIKTLDSDRHWTLHHRVRHSIWGGLQRAQRFLVFRKSRHLQY